MKSVIEISRERKERDARLCETVKIITDTVSKLVDVADKYHADRDFTIRHFAELFSAMAAISTFKNFEKDKNA